MEEIKQFASIVTPEPRFLFDRYKVSGDLFHKDLQKSGELEGQLEPENEERRPEQEKEDYFSFFNSHEKIILKPESTFKGLRSFLVHLPIDYYILL